MCSRDIQFFFINSAYFIHTPELPIGHRAVRTHSVFRPPKVAVGAPTQPNSVVYRVQHRRRLYYETGAHTFAASVGRSSLRLSSVYRCVSTQLRSRVHARARAITNKNRQNIFSIDIVVALSAQTPTRRLVGPSVQSTQTKVQPTHSSATN